MVLFDTFTSGAWTGNQNVYLTMERSTSMLFNIVVPDFQLSWEYCLTLRLLNRWDVQVVSLTCIRSQELGFLHRCIYTGDRGDFFV